MRQCLTSDLGGYYTRHSTASTDQFGKSGDFVTSPEISQIFGELIGIWIVAEWMAQGRKSTGLQLVELGPGRGTLLSDVLRTIRNFQPMAKSIETIYMIESSPNLREKQHAILCGDSPLHEHAIGHSSKSKLLPNANIIWTEDLNFIPKESDKSPFIIAHEFFDALPIHTFQAASVPREEPKQTIETPTGPIANPSASNSSSNTPQNEWRELLVTPVAPPSPFSAPTKPKIESNAEFELSVSKQPTNMSRLLPGLSPRYKALLSQTGSTIEISESARIIASQIANMVGNAPQTPSATPTSRPAQPSKQLKKEPSGAALIIDYGPASNIPVSTLRGIRNHQLVSPFESPGLVDLSADVDFGALVEAALDADDGVEVHGPVDQGYWLETMGGGERAEALVSKVEGGVDAASADQREGKVGITGGDDAATVKERIQTGWKRLVDRGPNGMGKLYRALAIVPARGGKRPVGFGGDVAG
ncbi:MAG: hypothetical protein Q9162_003775 [Coniocarpon cinnabarinum]